MQSYTGKTAVDLNVNGHTCSVCVKPSDTLLHTLRTPAWPP